MVAQSDKLLVDQWYLIFDRSGLRSGQYLERFRMHRCHSVSLGDERSSQLSKRVISSARLSHDNSNHAIAKPLLAYRGALITFRNGLPVRIQSSV